MANPAFLLHEAFTLVDKELAGKKGLHSGCTAIVAYIRTETRDGHTKVIILLLAVYTAASSSSPSNSLDYLPSLFLLASLVYSQRRRC